VQGLLVAGCGGPVIAGQLLYLAEVVEGIGLASLVTGAAEQVQRLPLAGSGGPVVPGQRVTVALAEEGIALAIAVLEVAV
jgi:hypothetical protein